MDIRAQLLNEHSAHNSDLIAAWISNDESRFAILIHLFLTDEYRIVQRAAMAFGRCIDDHPQLMSPYWEQLLSSCALPDAPDAVKRNVIRVIQNIPIPDEYLGMAASICFDLLANHKESIAVRAFSMTVLYNISLREPELQSELCLLIQDQWEHQSVGFRNRGAKILRAIQSGKHIKF
jgi:hypothetical protein